MSPKDILTPSELSVWELREGGARNRDVAKQLGKSPYNTAMLLRNARRRLRGQMPPARYSAVRLEVLAERDKRQRARMKALRKEKPCGRCHIRGHVAGDPDRCLSSRSLAPRFDWVL